MNIPEFHPSEEFVYDLKHRCLAAAAPNSIIPGLATRYAAKHGEDPEFQIFLRGKKHTEVSPWQQSMLEKLFLQEELKAAIEQGMEEYQTKHVKGLLPFEQAIWKEIKQTGVMPHLVLRAVVLDDLQQDVMLWLLSDADGNLDEHGIVIHLRKGRWRFDQLDYLIKYCEDIE